MKLGHDFGRVPMGCNQVLAYARRLRRHELAFGNATAAAIGEHDRRTRTSGVLPRDFKPYATFVDGEVLSVPIDTDMRGQP